MYENGSARRLFDPLYLLTLIWGIAVLWIAPRPPLIDLPQHAGQVALLHDLVMGTSPWSSIFKINMFTPYLIGYGLAFPLSFIMGVGTALKVVMSVAYAAFVLLGSRLRAHFNADPRLDWFFFLPFFGFAYTWGFYTFLASTPIVLLFILATDRYAQRMDVKRGVATAAAGLLLLLSHGLAFVFGAIVAGCLYTVRCQQGGGQWVQRWLRNFWPLLIPGLACVGYFINSMKLQQQYWAYGHLDVTWNISIMRFPRLLVNAIGDYYNPHVLLALAGLALFAVPWLFGMRLNRRNPAAWVMLAVVLFVEFLVPSTMISTAYVYERFALFAFPAYALIFMATGRTGADTATTTASAPTGVMAKVRASALPMAVLVAGTWVTLAFHSMEMWKFKQESADFEPVLAAMAPGQRVLQLTYSPASTSADLSQAYRHYATWYESEKQGLVDFNFGWFPPQIVRFRMDHLPQIKEGFKPQNFTVKKFPLDEYRYIIARNTMPLPKNLFQGAACPPRLVIKSGTWTLFERTDCPAALHVAQAPASAVVPR